MAIHEFDVAFWNRQKTNRHAAAQSEWLINRGLPDVLVLVEVTPDALKVFRQTTPMTWYSAAELSSVSGHGVAIGVSDRWTVSNAKTVQPACTADRPCLPERGLVLDIANEVVSISVGGWHAPYAAADKRRSKAENTAYKRHGYVHLAERLSEVRRPFVFGLDGNNWADSLDGATPAPASDPWYEERLFHSSGASHGMRDAVREAIRVRSNASASTLPATRRNRSGDYRMDRIYASPDLIVLDAGTDYGDGTNDGGDVHADPPSSSTRFAPGSDHALVWARLQLSDALTDASRSESGH